MAATTDLSLDNADGEDGDESEGLAPAARRRPASAPAADSVTYRPYHGGLLRPVRLRPSPTTAAAATGGLAIAVPTCRSFDGKLPGLELAAELAADQGSPLIVICSREARPEDFPKAITEELGESLFVAELPAPAATGLPALRTPRNRLSTMWRANDVGSKRNLGLAAAIRSGCEYLLFVDDDVSPYDYQPTLNGPGLRGALAAMQNRPQLRAVGWTMSEFPDNSVLGHARRLVGKPQHVFISGGALLVRCTATMPFFPDVYNEDWLFLIALAQEAADYQNCLGVVGKVRQRPYQPYSEQRTRSEEAGDILGEGLMNLLEDDGPGHWARSTSADYWKRVVDRRAGLIRDIVSCLDGEPATTERQDARAAMEVALAVHRDIEPAELGGYVGDWRSDLAIWREVSAPAAGTGTAEPGLLTRMSGFLAARR